jgi:hypothetical protein
MKRLLTMIVAYLGLASATSAQTLTVIPDKSEYEVGDAIFLTVVGDAQGLGARRVFGLLRFHPSVGVAVGVQSIMQPVTSLNGTLTWVAGKPQCGLFGCTGFSHAQGNTSFPPDGPIVSTLVLFANVPGTVSLDWETRGAFALDFFGLESAPAATASPMSTTFDSVDVQNDTIVANDVDFLVAGFEAGCSVAVSGSASNDARYTIAAISTTTNPNDTLEIAGDVLLDEGPVGGVTLSAPAVCLTILPPPFQPEIDIKPLEPGDPADPEGRNPINLAGSSIAVAILSTDTFDALEIDGDTLAFGPAGAPLLHSSGPHPEDVNGDGSIDLVTHFATAETGIALGDVEACVTGELFDGTRIEGCDVIAVQIPSCGIGFELALLLPPILWARKRLDR